MIMSLNIYAPRIQRIGGGALEQLPDVLDALGAKNPLIVTDGFMVESGMVTRVADLLRVSGAGHGVFSDTVPDPTTDVVAAGVATLHAGKHDSLIGFGGGSPMDTAKAIAILAAGGGQMRDWKVPRLADLPDALPVIAIPTTAGTGSEVTRFTIITDTQSDEKMLINGLAALPAAAIVDYTLTMAKPFRLTADTGIDTLTHALEAFVSRKANAVSDIYARSAMQLVAQHLETACFQPQDHTAREGMALAANLGGLAFSNASVALVHGMSRPIGAHFHVPHGLSNAMLLPEVTAFSIPGAPDRYATAARLMGWADASADDKSACDALLDGLKALNVRLDVPSPFDWGINPDKWATLSPLMAEQALASGSPANNPRIPDAGEIEQLYSAIGAG
ncbi:MAG: iron-containing alcohol dehydrogenase [Alphaproteobacteria bacterium]